MESNRLIKLSLGIMIAVIITATALMPVITDATQTEKTFVNEGYFYLDKVGESRTIFWDPTDPTTITVDGTAMDLPAIGTGNFSYTIVAGQHIMCRYMLNSGEYSIVFNAGDGLSITSTNTNPSNNYATVTVEIDNGDFTITKSPINGDSDIVKNFSETSDLYTISKTGPYVMKNASDSVKMHGSDSVIFACGRTTGGGVALSLSAIGTIDGGVTITQFFGDNATFGDVTINKTKVNGYVDLYDFSSLQFLITQGEHSLNATYNYVIVPHEVTAELAVHLNSGQIAMVNAIPFVVIATILAAAVAMMMLKRE